MKPITMSALPIVARCPASWALPHAREADPSEPAERGSAIHAFLADVTKHGRDAALERVPEEFRPACELIDTDRLPTHLAAEVTFRLDLWGERAEEVGRDLDRSTYAKRTGEAWVVYGTADLVGIDEESDAVVVYDYKTGWSTQDDAADHWQIKALALAAAWAYGKANARVGIIRVWETGRVSYDVAELDTFDLEGAAEELNRILDARVKAGEDLREGLAPSVTTGRHCRYCPAFHSCPAQVALARQVAAAPYELDRQLAELITTENAAKAYHRIAQVQMVLDRVKKQIHALAEKEPIPLGNGRMLGPVERSRESIVGEKAMPILREHFGAEVAEAAIEISITKGRLKNALQSYAKQTGSKITHVERQALDLLRKSGGVSVSTSRMVAEYEVNK